MNILDYAKEHILYLDGGMGTLLQARGLVPGQLPEGWNLSHPEVITAIHRAYYDAGSHVVNTNTFGANRLKFSPAECPKGCFRQHRHPGKMGSPGHRPHRKNAEALR